MDEELKEKLWAELFNDDRDTWLFHKILEVSTPENHINIAKRQTEEILFIIDLLGYVVVKKEEYEVLAIKAAEYKRIHS